MPGSVLALALGGGCSQQTLDNVEESNSILAFLPSAPTPAEAARWSQDPYDADKRFRGTNLLANAPFGGEDVYIATYRMKLGAPPATEPDGDSGVRGVAARALSLHGAGEDAVLILPLLSDPDRRTRLEGVRALQRLHNPVAIDPLLAALDPKKELEFDVRAEAATALGQYAEPRVLQGLIGALDDDNLAVTRSAQHSLKILTGQALGEDTRAWVEWAKSTKTPFAAGSAYEYPVFNRDRYWFEYIPLVPQPPNEVAAAPAGLSGEPGVVLAAPPAAAPGGSTPGASAPASASAASAATAPPSGTNSVAAAPAPGTATAVATGPTTGPAPAPSSPTVAASGAGQPGAASPPSAAPPAPGAPGAGPGPRPEPLPGVPAAGNPPPPSGPGGETLPPPGTPAGQGPRPGFVPGKPVQPRKP